MDKYIKQLLLLHSKIILPEFGAIVIADEETGELMFNEYLNYDDGKLSALLEKESNMDLQEAQNNVAKFIRELKSHLDKGETYSIFQLGEFSKTEDGTFIFEGNVKAGGKSLADVINGPSPTPPVKEKKLEIKKEKTRSESKPEKVKTEDKVEEPIEKIAIVPETKPKEKTEEKSSIKKNIYVEKGADAFTSTVKLNKDIEPQPVIIDKKEKRKRGILFWCLLIIIILVVFGSGYLVINYNKIEERISWSLYSDTEKESTEEQNSSTENKTVEKGTDKSSVSKEDENIEEENLTEGKVAEKIKEPVHKDPTPLDSSRGQHHIVIGCFGELTNAKNQVTDYKQKGFDAKILGQFGGLHFVVAQSYPTLKEAKADLSRVRQFNEKAWLYNR